MPRYWLTIDHDARITAYNRGRAMQAADGLIADTCDQFAVDVGLAADGHNRAAMTQFVTQDDKRTPHANLLLAPQSAYKPLFYIGFSMRYDLG